MTQTTNRLFDDLARLMTDAAGAAEGVRREAESMLRSQAERMVQGMDLVSREEFEVVRTMAEKARAENERLASEVTRLEARIAEIERRLAPGTPSA